MKKIFLILPLALLASSLSAQTEVDQKVLDMAASIQDRVAEIRGHPFKHEVAKGIYDRTQLKGFLLENFEDDLPDEKLRGWETALKIFGMLPGDYDLKEGLLNFLVSQVGGFYDPEEKQLNCITSNLSYLQHIVMVHEIAHALQDQYLDLQGYYDGVQFNDDILAAREAVIEGEAQYVTNRYMNAHALEIAAELAEMDAKDMGLFALTQGLSMQGAPPYLSEMMMFPYIEGERFITAVVKEGGFGRVDLLYRIPPRSSEQILHPDKFWQDMDDPVKVVLPSLDDVLGVEYHRIYENSLGEIQTAVLLKLTSDPIRAPKAAAGWGGDTYAVYENMVTGRSVMIGVFTFDSEKDGAEFFESEARGLGRKYRAWGGGPGPKSHPEARERFAYFFAEDGSTGFLEMRGKDVVLLDRFPPAPRRLIHEARDRAWDFQKGKFDFKAMRPVPYPEAQND